MTDTLRKYGYGTPLLIQTVSGQIKRVTAIGSGMEGEDCVCDYVDQQGNEGWVYDKQIVRVLE